MKKLFLFILLIVCTVSFTVPGWCKTDGDPPLTISGGTSKVDTIIYKTRKDGDPPVVKTSGTLLVDQGIVWDGDPPAPPK